MKTVKSYTQCSLLLVILFLFGSISGYAQVLPDDPFCESSNPRDCFADHLKTAELVFEGTVLESTRYQDKKGNWKVETMYRVEKIFKGRIKGSTIRKIVDQNTVLQNYYDWHLRTYGESLSSGGIVTKKIGTTELVLGMKVKDSNTLNLKETLIVDLYTNYSLKYNLNRDRVEPHKKADHLIHSKRGESSSLRFKDTKELYAFVLKQDQMSLSDMTHKRFIQRKTKAEILSEKATGPGQKKIPNPAPLNMPMIETFTESVPGGVGSILTIIGDNFGDNPGQIWFDAASYNGSVIKLDNYDLNVGVVSWGDDEIQIRLPGNVNDLNEGAMFETYGPRTLMSARISVINKDNEGSFWSDDKVNISYSAQQKIEQSAVNPQFVLNKRRVKIVTKSTDNIFYFHVNDEIFNDCELMADINTAMKIWKCKTGIDWRIADKTSANAGGQDDISLFFRGEDCCAIALPQFGEVCVSSSEIYENDISSCPTILSDPFCLMGGGILSTFLHELGHVHGLNHTLPGDASFPIDLMHAPQAGAHADVITADDLDGANAVKTNSLSAICNNVINFKSCGDYAMRDNPNDIGQEPNCTAVSNADIFGSPDVWNCLSPGCTENEPPLEGNINWMHARVKNISEECDAREGEVAFYWTVASTGEVWMDDWINDYFGDCLIGDYIGSAPIGILSPQQERIVERNWVAPNINALIECGVPRYPWDIQNENYQVCLLARILHDEDYMFIEKDGIEVKDNVVNSNNIVTKNTYLVDDPGQLIYANPSVRWIGNEPSFFFFTNNNDHAVELDLVINNLTSSNPNDLRYMQLLLSDDLFNRVDPSQRRRLFGFNDRTSIVQIDGRSSEFRLRNIRMAPGEMQLIGLRLAVSSDMVDEYDRRSSPTELSIHHEASNPREQINATSACFVTIPTVRGESTLRNKIENGLIDSQNNPESIETVDFYSTTGVLLKSLKFKQMTRTDIPVNQLLILTYRNKSGNIVRSEKVFITR